MEQAHYVKQFLAHQLGVSVFTWDSASGDYVAKTFNIYVMPPDEKTTPHGELHVERFLCDAGSLHFLATNGFDFTTWVHEGAPYCPMSKRKEIFARYEVVEIECIR